jgi:antitoxin MazE
MEISIIKIGNSKGLRLSKTILEKYNIKKKVEMILEEGQIILKPIEEPRKNWAQAFKEMSLNEDDELLIDDVFEDDNIEEWK